MRSLVMVLAVTLAAGGLLRAQDTEPLTYTKSAHHTIMQLMVAMAEKMPEEYYSFKPTPEMRTFGELVAHVTRHQEMFCSASMGIRKDMEQTGNKPKAELVAALKSSFATCETAIKAFGGGDASATVEFRNSKVSKFRLLMLDLLHSNEEYGYMAVYLRLKGVVPPSSDPEFRKTHP